MIAVGTKNIQHINLILLSASQIKSSPSRILDEFSILLDAKDVNGVVIEYLDCSSWKSSIII